MFKQSVFRRFKVQHRSTFIFQALTSEQKTEPNVEPPKFTSLPERSLKQEKDIKDVKDVKLELSRYDSLRDTAQELMRIQVNSTADVDQLVCTNLKRKFKFVPDPKSYKITGDLQQPNKQY